MIMMRILWTKILFIIFVYINYFLIFEVDINCNKKPTHLSGFILCFI
jgi:hypothetical protein